MFQILLELLSHLFNIRILSLILQERTNFSKSFPESKYNTCFLKTTVTAKINVSKMAQKQEKCISYSHKVPVRVLLVSDGSPQDNLGSKLLHL